MKTFRFYVDEKSTIWNRGTFHIEAETYEEAVAKVKEIQTKDEMFDTDITWEDQPETMGSMTVEENRGNPTLEIYSGLLLYLILIQERNSMSRFQNSCVIFRCPASFKAKMRAFAEANDQHLSSFIRSACSEVLRREMGDSRFNIPTQKEISRHLDEVA